MKKYLFAAIPGLGCILVAVVLAYSGPRAGAPIPMADWKAAIAGTWLMIGVILLALFLGLMALYDLFGAWDRYRARRRGERPEADRRPLA